MSLLRPILRPILQPLLRSPLEPGVGGRLSAFSAAKYAIQQDAADVNILVIGDSTGNATDEWVYLFGQWLATEYTTHSVSYRLWNDTSEVYDAAVALGTGSGANTIRVWNASISGAPAFYLVGAKQPAAVEGLAADLIIFNHGHNDLFGSTAQRKGEILMGWEAARAVYPAANFAAIIQNPRRDDDDYAPMVDVLNDAASDYGDVALVDVYSRYIAAGKPSAWYADNIHPAGDGIAAWVDEVKLRWAGSAAGSLAAADALLSASVTNALANGDFSAFDGAVPDGWTALSTPTCAKETVIVDGASAYSLKLTGTNGGARIQANATDVSAFAGKKATLAVRVFIPSGSPGTVGRISLNYVLGGAVADTTRSIDAGQGGWCWKIIAGVDIPVGATFVSATLYCDSAANASSAVYYDRAILVVGDIPRDMA